MSRQQIRRRMNGHQLPDPLLDLVADYSAESEANRLAGVIGELYATGDRIKIYTYPDVGCVLWASGASRVELCYTCRSWPSDSIHWQSADDMLAAMKSYSLTLRIKCWFTAKSIRWPIEDILLGMADVWTGPGSLADRPFAQKTDDSPADLPQLLDPKSIS